MRKRIYLMRPKVGPEEVSSIKNVIKSKFLSEGKITQKFEAAVSKYTKAKYSIATTSATTALHTVFECMNICGKKVFVSDFTFPATALAVQLAGGIPVLIDVERDTMNPSKSIVEDSLDNKTKFVVPVSIFGNPLERSFYGLKKKGIKIIEDAATTLGAKLGKDYVGNLADVSCFSFHPRKIITTGEGGMITTNDALLANKCNTFKMFGRKKDNFAEIGTNYKLSDIQSAMGIIQLKKIESMIKKRINYAKIYNELLEKINHITPQKPTKNSRHTYQSYTCIMSKPNLRNKIIKELSKNNVESQIGTYALHCLPAFKKCIKKGNLQNSKFLYENTISLPLHEELTQKDQEFICKIIKNMIN